MHIGELSTKALPSTINLLLSRVSNASHHFTEVIEKEINFLYSPNSDRPEQFFRRDSHGQHKPPIVEFEAEMEMMKQAIIKIGLISWIGLLVGCAEVVVPGAFTGGGEYYRYTTTSVGEKTLMGDVDQTTAATKKALEKMNIRFHAANTVDFDTEITASTSDLDITVTMEAITSTTTKVTVNAVKDHVFKDKATAAQLVSQIEAELNRDLSHDNFYPKVYLKNDCRYTIDVIVYYLAGKNGPETWQTRGWFSLAPGQMKYAADTHNRYIYLYNEARSKDKLAWSGSISQWFEGSYYDFFKVDMGTQLTDYTHSFACD